MATKKLTECMHTLSLSFPTDCVPVSDKNSVVHNDTARNDCFTICEQYYGMHLLPIPCPPLQ